MHISRLHQVVAPFDFITLNVPLKRYISLRVGGNADALALIKTVPDLQRLLQVARQYDLPLYFLGKGTNVIFTDAGFRGIVVKLGGEFHQFERLESSLVDGSIEIRAGAALSLQKLVNYCVRHHFTGMEEGAGIPASIGGAVAMNAGVPGWEFGDYVTRIEGLTADNQRHALMPSDFQFEYRRGNLPPGFVVTHVTIRVKKGDPETIKARVGRIMQIRKSRQPLQYPNCGSVFKNPPGDYAGRLIETCGLKGYRIGGALISEKHANFIINPSGEASAADVLHLIDLAQETVWSHHHVQLETEVQIIPPQ